MMWPWPLPARGELCAAVVILLIIGAAVFGFIKYPFGGRGFGPEWDCTQPAEGDPVCIKRSPAPPTNQK